MSVFLITQKLIELCNIAFNDEISYSNFDTEIPITDENGKIIIINGSILTEKKAYTPANKPTIFAGNQKIPQNKIPYLLIHHLTTQQMSSTMITDTQQDKSLYSIRRLMKYIFRFECVSQNSSGLYDEQIQFLEIIYFNLIHNSHSLGSDFTFCDVVTNPRNVPILESSDILNKSIMDVSFMGYSKIQKSETFAKKTTVQLDGDLGNEEILINH